MKAPNTPTKTRPDPNSGEKQWFSPLPVPSNFKRLSTTEPIARSLFERVEEGIAEAVMFLPPGHLYEAKYFIDGWDALKHGDKCRGGRCIADFARRRGAPIVRVLLGKSPKSLYFVRHTEPQPPVMHADLHQHHQP